MLVVNGCFLLILISRRRSSCLRNIINFKYFSCCLLATTMVLIRCPLVIEFSPDLPILPFLISFPYKGMLEKLRPCQSFTWSLVQKPLQETFEFRTHIFRELHRVLNNQVDECINAVGIERRGSHKEFVNDDTQGPEINSVIIWQFLYKLRRHI